MTELYRSRPYTVGLLYWIQVAYKNADPIYCEVHTHQLLIPTHHMYHTSHTHAPFSCMTLSGYVLSDRALNSALRVRLDHNNLILEN